MYRVRKICAVNRLSPKRTQRALLLCVCAFVCVSGKHRSSKNSTRVKADCVNLAHACPFSGRFLSAWAVCVRHRRRRRYSREGVLWHTRKEIAPRSPYALIDRSPLGHQQVSRSAFTPVSYNTQRCAVGRQASKQASDFDWTTSTDRWSAHDTSTHSTINGPTPLGERSAGLGIFSYETNVVPCRRVMFCSRPSHLVEDC